MFNSDLKTEFIKSREKEAIIDPNFLKRIFKRSEHLEIQEGKDLYLFSVGEIIDFYKLLETRSINVLININTQLSFYTSWCMSRNLVSSGINNFQEITIDMLNLCVNKLALEEGIMSEDKIYKIINMMRNAREKFSLQMIYETGKSKNLSNIFEVKISDFDPNKKIAKLPDGRKVAITERLYYIAKEADSELDYNSYIITPSNSDSRQRKLIDLGYIYKETDTVKTNTIKNKLYRFDSGINKGFKAAGISKYIKTKDFQYSGIINHIKHMASDNNVSWEDIVWDRSSREIIKNQHNYPINTPKQFIRKFGEYF